MSDKTETAAVPAWLAGGELQPVAPVSDNCPHGSPLDGHGNASSCSACILEKIETDKSRYELLGITGQRPEPEPGKPEPIEVATVADMLIKGKRFWQAPAHTEDEQIAALEFAGYLIGIMRNGDQS